MADGAVQRVRADRPLLPLPGLNRTALVVPHDLGLEGVDTFLGGVQGACGSSGPNYRPYRVWSDEELEAAAQGCRPAADPSWHEPARRVVCQVVKINNAERPE